MINENIDGVVLAAGFSSRIRAFKMELRLGEKSMLQRVIEAMQDFCPRVIVVAGFAGERVTRLTAGYTGVQVVFNPDYAKGMFTSVKEGIKHVTAGWFFLTPGDYPLISKPVYRKLLEARTGFINDHIFIPAVKGKKGHPILVKSTLVPELLGEPAESNLRQFIQRKGFVTIEVDDENILLDIDTGEDYRKALEKSGGLSRVK